MIQESGIKMKSSWRKEKFFDRLKLTADKLTTGMDQLTESEELIAKVQAQLKGVEGKDADSLRKTSTKMQDEIKSIREDISGKSSELQGLSRNPFQVTVMSQMQLAQQSISSKMVVPGQHEEALVANAEKAVSDLIKKINSFYEQVFQNRRLDVLRHTDGKQQFCPNQKSCFDNGCGKWYRKSNRIRLCQKRVYYLCNG